MAIVVNTDTNCLILFYSDTSIVANRQIEYHHWTTDSVVQYLNVVLIWRIRRANMLIMLCSHSQ